MITVAALYRFTRLKDPAALREPLRRLCIEQGLRGSLLLAREGVNGTVAGPAAGIERLVARLRSLPGMAELDVKLSGTRTMPFNRMKVRLKREIVTMGQPHVDPGAAVGRYVEPRDWNALIAAEDVVVIDTRNAYETAIGSFDGAIDPGTERFGDFPAWWQANRERFAGKRVAMFCTGGIRCEKSTSFLRGQGVEDVYHLRGGILKYLEEIPEAESRWNGECYVFDHRVSVGHGLRPGDYTPCHACGRPVSPEARMDPLFEEGVQCPACVDEYDAARRERFRERQRQNRLAAERGERHLGSRRD